VLGVSCDESVCMHLMCYNEERRTERVELYYSRSWKQRRTSDYMHELELVDCGVKSAQTAVQTLTAVKNMLKMCSGAGGTTCVTACLVCVCMSLSRCGGEGGYGLLQLFLVK
jgi:hypothetical protein